MALAITNLYFYGVLFYNQPVYKRKKLKLSDVAIVGSNGSHNGVGNAEMSKEKAINYAKGLRETLEIPVVLKDHLHIN